MKRVAWLLILSVLSFNTLGFRPLASTTGSISLQSSNVQPSLNLQPLAVWLPGTHAVCNNTGATRVCASVSTARAESHTYVTVYGVIKTSGVGQAGKIMTATLLSKGSATCSAVTDSDGMASCSIYFSGLAKGNVVRVKVTIGKYKLMPHFAAK